MNPPTLTPTQQKLLAFMAGNSADFDKVYAIYPPRSETYSTKNMFIQIVADMQAVHAYLEWAHKRLLISGKSMLISFMTVEQELNKQN